MPKRELIVLTLYTLFNIISNQFIGLYSDEAYYWLWSKNLGLSYFDHAPMVAYLISLSTIFSDEALFVRLPAALLVSGTSVVLYTFAKKIFDEKVAIYTFYIYISSIIILGASTLITPDIPMMFFWSLSLYSAYMYIEEDKKAYALLLGISAGLMILSKYTGVLPLVFILLYTTIYKRAIFKDIYFYMAILLTIIIFSPVLIWNYQHDFISFTFQLQHGMQSEEKVFLAKEFFNFVGIQFALFHPLYLLPLFYFIIKDRERFEKKKVFLLLPFLGVLFFFSYNAAYKHANAQWAAGAYLSASILLAYYFEKYKANKLLFTALSISILVIVLVKTPLGDYVKPIKKLHNRLGKIDKFEKEIKQMNLDLDKYDYLIVDDYHGAEIPYYFKRSKNVLVLSSARFSQFNIWRSDDLNISMQSSIKSIPSLGKCLYISRNIRYIEQIEKLFGNKNIINYEKKRVGSKTLEYYFVEFEN